MHCGILDDKGGRTVENKEYGWKRWLAAAAGFLLMVPMIFLLPGCGDAPLPQPVKPKSAAYRKVEAFANEKGLSMDLWPEELIDLLERNPETEEYVLHYPLGKDSPPQTDLAALAGTDRIPALYQWDARWGYTQYNESYMGLSGCGPTCLSMVCLYVLEDPTLTPQYLAKFSEENGYCSKGQGSHWSLFSEGGPKLGMEVIEIPLDENRIIRNLEVGNPIVCNMGPGDFTTGGHYIVMVGYEDGKIRVNDPNSPERTAQLWEYERIKSQIRNLWVCR